MRWLDEWLDDDALAIGGHSILIILAVLLASITPSLIFGEIRINGETLRGYALVLTIYFLGLVVFAGGFREFRKFQLVENLPTSKIRSASIGMTELKGRFLPLGESVTAPISRRECSFYDTRVEQKTREEGESDYYWKTILHERPRSFMVLDDGTGQVPIQVGAAELKFKPEVHDSVGDWEDMGRQLKTFIQDSGVEEKIESNDEFLVNNEVRFREKVIEKRETCYSLGFLRRNDRKDPELAGFETLIDRQRSDPFIVTKEDEKNLKGSIKRKTGILLLSGALMSLAGYAAFLGMSGMY